MGLLNEEDKKYLIEQFDENIKRDVELLFFKGDNNSDYSKQIKDLLSELVSLNDRLSLKIKDCSNKDDMKEEGIHLCPSVKVKSSRKGFMNFYGAPAGYEFSALIEDIVFMGSDNMPLSDEIIGELEDIKKPVDIKVFTTSSCPYCTKAVRTVHVFSLANDNIRGSMVDAYGFPELARDNNVSSVPHIVINGNVSFVGALPEHEFLSRIKEAIN